MSTKPKIMQNACRETLKNSGKMQKRSQKGPKTDAKRTQNKQNTTSNDRKDAKTITEAQKTTTYHITPKCATMIRTVPTNTKCCKMSEKRQK